MKQNTYNKYYFPNTDLEINKFCPVLFALLFDQGNKKFLPQSAGKCISQGLISKIFKTPLEAQALRAFTYMAYGHVIHVTGDI